ncbi:MAG: hypothetical protein EOM66_00995 [Clostridia bacterium]|nr:hypothetical protein [Clostridia bacterium]
MQTNIVGTLFMLLYLCLMLVIGWYSSNRIKSNADFVVAGRSLGPWILAATLAATEIGGGSSLGVVQQGMEGFGIRSALYVVAVGVSYALLAFWAPTARRDNVKTTPEFFRRRYGDASGAIQAVLIILSSLGDAVAQYVVSGTIISVMLNIDFQMGLIISAVVVTTYSVLGGLWSISATDFVQMFLIFAGMAIVVPHAMQLVGGWSNVVAAVPAEALVFYQDGDLLYVVSLIVMFTTSLRCQFANLSKDEIEEMNSDQKSNVSFQGTCAGIGKDGVLLLKNCVLLSEF